MVGWCWLFTGSICVLLAQEFLQRIQARAPEVPCLFDPLCGCIQRLRAVAEEVVAAHLAALHQLGALQHQDVFAHRVQRHLEGLRDIGHARFSRRQALQDRAARGVGEREQGAVKRSWGGHEGTNIFNHLVECKIVNRLRS
jgi:hypothetical protein